MTLLTAMADRFHSPAIEIFLGTSRQRLHPVSATVDHGLQMGASRASVTVLNAPNLSAGLRVPIEIRMGWDGYTVPVFVGLTEGSAQPLSPYGYTFHALGHLKLTQYNHPEEMFWLDSTDEAIVTDILNACGITQYDIEGSGHVFGVAQGVVMPADSSPWSLIQRLDDVTGYFTFDGPDGTVRRRRVSWLPTELGAFDYEQGVDILGGTRERRIDEIRNRVVVTGLIQDEYEPWAEQVDDSPYIPTPPQYVSHNFQSELIETDEYATTVATRLMTELNHVSERYNGGEIVGNPYLRPAMTIRVSAWQQALDGFVAYVLMGFQHQFNASGFTTTLSLEGGIGAPGEPGDPGNYPDPTPEPSPGPEPAISYTLSREGFVPEGAEVADTTYDLSATETGYESITLYTFNGDALGSYAPDALPDTLTFAWSNNKNADTGTERFYGTAFTKTQMETEGNCTVSLTVTDENAESRTLTIPLTATEAQQRQLYAVLGGSSEAGLTGRILASPDGGETWRTYTTQGRPDSEGEPVFTYTEPVASVDYFGLTTYVDPGMTWDEFNEYAVSQLRAVGAPTQVDSRHGAIAGGGELIIRVAIGSEWGTAGVQPGANTGDGIFHFHNPPFIYDFFEWRLGRYETSYGDPGDITCVTEIAGGDFALYGDTLGMLHKLVVAESEPGGFSVSPVWDVKYQARYEEYAEAALPRVSAVWLTETDHTQATVIMDDGMVFRGSINDPQGASDGQAQWEELGSGLTDATHLIQSAMRPGEYRVSGGGETSLTHNSFAGMAGAVTYTSASRTMGHSALGNFANYGTVRAQELGEVRRELDNALITLPTLPAAPDASLDDEWPTIGAITSHIREHGLWGITAWGVALYKPEDSDAFTVLGEIPLGYRTKGSGTSFYGSIWRAIRDGGAFLTLYVAGVYGVHKSWDGGNNWRHSFLMDMNTDADLDGAITATMIEEDKQVFAIGYGSPQWTL